MLHEVVFGVFPGVLVIKVEKAWLRFIQVVSVNPSVKGQITVFSPRVSLLPLYTSEKV